jgi:predicted phage tail protein
MAESKAETTYWVMQQTKVVHVTLDSDEAEKVLNLAQVSSLAEALKALGVTQDKLREAMIEAKKATRSREPRQASNKTYQPSVADMLRARKKKPRQCGEKDVIAYSSKR